MIIKIYLRNEDVSRFVSKICLLTFVDNLSKLCNNMSTRRQPKLNNFEAGDVANKLPGLQPCFRLLLAHIFSQVAVTPDQKQNFPVTIYVFMYLC